MRCPWCKEDKPLVTIMIVTEIGSEIGQVCAKCRKKWLRKLKSEVGMDG